MPYDPNAPTSTLNIPKLSLELGSPETIRVYEGGSLIPVDIKNLVMTESERARVGYNGYQGIDLGTAVSRFQQQFGFNPTTLPTLNYADAAQRLVEAGLGKQQGLSRPVQDIFKEYGASKLNPATAITKTKTPENIFGAAYSVDGKEILRSPALGSATFYANTQPNYLPAPYPAQSVNMGAITPSSLASAGTTNFQTPSIQPPYNVANLPTPTLGAEAQKAQTQTELAQRLLTQLEGRGAYQREQEDIFRQKYGVDEKTMNDLTAQLTAIKNEAAAIPLQLQQGAAERGVTTSLLRAQENSRLRTNAIAALGVSTTLAALQGQMATAQYYADRAVEQKYGPIEAQYKTTLANLDLIRQSPAFTVEEKTRAEQQELNTRLQLDKLTRARSNEETSQKVAIDALQYTTQFKPSPQYPTLTIAVDAMKSANPVTAQQIASSVNLIKPTEKQILGSATTGYFSYDPITGKKTLISGPQPSGNQYANEIEQYAQDVSSGKIKLASVPQSIRAEVSAKVEEMKSIKYSSEQDARNDYDIELRKLEGALKTNPNAALPSQIKQALIDVYGKWISSQEINATVDKIFNINQTQVVTPPIAQSSASNSFFDRLFTFGKF